ncbi:mannosyltransferase family protein [Frondihabitans australicus]|uniref:Mannosyltransferase PIG-V n=1 Tax=Frondihabitans australicus TaxID=386892 RepID=A0A495IBH7_9MICO|nr:mannosyltransferase family protein [Frondihabitans australicus]RKR73353.1 mannosyltransferase PIG-V [Frondihabitans australicus]
MTALDGAGLDRGAPRLDGSRRASPPPSLARVSWRPALLGTAAIWVVVRLVLTVYSLVVTSTSTAVPVQPAVPHSFFTLLYHWDSSYFLEIAHNGYFAAADPPDLQAFLPGYPLAGRLATLVLFPGQGPTVPHLLVGLWLAAAIPSFVAGVGLWRITEDRFGPRVAAGAVVLLLAGPYSVFLAASYSESLFLAFAVFAWYHALRGRWWAAGLLAAGASLTRIDGVFLAVALGVVVLQEHGRLTRRAVLRAVGVVALSLSTLVGYFVYLAAVTGDPLSWLTAERHGWHRRFTVPWVSGLETLRTALDPARSSPLRAQALLEVVFAILCLAGLVVLARRRRWGAVILVGSTLASLMTSTTYLSLSRESLLLFPLTMTVASYRDHPSRRWVFRAGLAASILLLFFNTHQFVLGLWTQ